MTATHDTIDLVELAEREVRDTFDRFSKPGDDLAPALIFRCRNRRRVAAIAIDTSERYAACAQIEQTLSACHAAEAVCVASAWCGASHSPRRPSLDPDRRECIILMHVTGDSVEGMLAFIERFADRPPDLGPFTQQGPECGGLRRRAAPWHRLSSTLSTYQQSQRWTTLASPVGGHR